MITPTSAAKSVAVISTIACFTLSYRCFCLAKKKWKKARAIATNQANTQEQTDRNKTNITYVTGNVPSEVETLVATLPTEFPTTLSDKIPDAEPVGSWATPIKPTITSIAPVAAMPSYATKKSAGFDIRSQETLVLMPGQTRAVSTNLQANLPDGMELQIRSRSGLALKDIVVANAPGTIDPDYTGEIKVILRNQGSTPYHIQLGTRIAQGVLAPFFRAENLEISGKTRKSGGFGSTGN